MPAWSLKENLYTLLLVAYYGSSAITISSESSDESVESPPSRVILFGDIPTVIPATSVIALETSYYWLLLFPSARSLIVETTLSLHPQDCVAWFPIRVPILIHQMRCLHQAHFPATSYFTIHMRPILLLRLLILLDGPPLQDLLMLPLLVGEQGEAIPFGRPYRTYQNGPRKLLTARKIVDLTITQISIEAAPASFSISSLILLQFIFGFPSPVHSLGLMRQISHSGS
ncbi:hypothetical protein Tco_0956269 [Tanacetum coccineum]|uniref:Cytochrome c biogenesis B n=1 Tax=Tanacetum coccineum TaxID=301880 RepID=A0ABQ5E9G8_9ASTR